MTTPAPRAAIYARKSTDQNGVVEANKSVTRQKELARAFALSRGWTVVAEYEDDGISGAEFEKRPGFQAMLAAASRGDFRLPGRGRTESPRPRGATRPNTLSSDWRRRGSRSGPTWTAASRPATAGQGHVVAARLGRRSAPGRYRTPHARGPQAESSAWLCGRGPGVRLPNEHVYSGTDVHGNPLREGTRRVINPEEAAVVRQIFALYASGLGLRAIAKRLTTERAPQPLSPTRTDGLTAPGWAPSTVRTILCRELYRGVIVWNRSRKRDDWGQVSQKPRPPDEWTRTVDETLRIIPDDLWKQVACRREDTEGRALRFAGGRMSGRPTKRPP